MRAFASNLALALLSSLVALTLLEVAFRLRPDDGGDRPTAVETRRSGHWRQPDFRDRSYLPLKRKRGFRVLVIGDSFTWGSGVHAEDAYPDRLGRAVDRLKVREPIEVVNWSRPGWNTVHELRALQRHRPKVQFDLVIVGFVLNDAEPPKADHVERLREQLRLGPPESSEPRSAAARLAVAGSALASFTWRRLENSRRRRALTEYYLSLYGPDGGWDQAQAALAQLLEIARHADAPAVLLIFPIFDSPLDQRYPYRDLHARVAESGGAMGYLVLDLLPSFDAMDTRRLAVEPFVDPHPNELAHRIAADSLADFLTQRQLLPLIAPRGAGPDMETRR